MSDEADRKSVTIMYGNHTFKHSSSRVTVHACPTDGSKRVFPVDVLGGGRAKPKHLSAAKNGYEDHGSWYRGQYLHKDGVILSLQLNVSYNGATRTSAVMLVRLREGANLIMVNAVLSKDAGATYGTLPAFTGHADVLSLAEAEELGVEFPRGMRGVYFDEEEIEEEFEVVELAEGTIPEKPQTVKVKRGGETKVVMIQGTKRRRLKVKRGS